MASTESRTRRAPRPGGASAARARVAERAGAILEIDLDAIAANWRKLADRVAPGARCAAVVKADAYGLGVAKVAPALARAGAKTFFVVLLRRGAY